MNSLIISGFLKYGYFFDYERDDYKLDLTKIEKNKYSNFNERELINLGIKKFKNAIAQEFIPNKLNLVPLSGGLDSRAILAGLLEFTEAKNIATYTFGTPGTLDYDIGNYVAKKVGTNHVSFPLNQYDYTEEELIEISHRIRHQTMLFHHPPLKIVDEYFGDHIVWSGFIGDVIAGGQLQRNKVSSLEEAKKNYLSKNVYCKSINLSPFSENDFIKYINFPDIDKDLLTYEEQVFLLERVKKLTVPHVLMKGFTYKTPFINNNFMNFMLSIDNRYRFGEQLFIKMMLKAYPSLFKLKSKTSYGLPINSSIFAQNIKRGLNKIKRLTSKKVKFIKNPYTNYLDFDNEFRDNINLKNIIYNSIQDLKQRQIVDWIDIDSIWENHQKKHGNFSDALILLTSLEIHLKAKESARND